MAQPKFFARGILLLVVVACLVGGAALVPSLVSVRAAQNLNPLPGNVLISEFRFRGSGGPADEFVELYNSSHVTVNLNGWILKRCDQGTTDPIYTFPVSPPNISLDPGRHYLLANSAYDDLVHADATYASVSGIKDDGGVAISDGTATIDGVGLTSGDTDCVETAAVAPLFPPTANVDQSYERIFDGFGSCVDTNNNLNDFVRINPSDPQNTSSTPSSPCGNPTPMPTSSPTPVTPTLTKTPLPSKTPVVFSPAVLINEIGWSGTKANPDDQWIELKNISNQKVVLDDGWKLDALSGDPAPITLKGTIEPGKYFLLVHGPKGQATATPSSNTCVVFSDVKYDQIFTGLLDPNGDTLYLYDPGGNPVDRANSGYGNPWPAGSDTNNASMERHAVVQDSKSAWFTFDGGPNYSKAHDCASSPNPIYGTPRQPNWSVGLVATPSPTPTNTRRPTPRPLKPYAHMVINEFLPRAGYDWNGDGAVDIYDEFIEIENLGPVDGNLLNFELDVIGDTTSSYRFPSVPLKVGQRALYFGATTHLLLHDSGATVRLLDKYGIVVDARGYGVVDHADQSWCRIPDGAGYWTHPCFPTPGTINSLTGTVPVLSPNGILPPLVCQMPDTVPDAFRQAECDAYGAGIFNPAYWDDQAGHGEFLVPDIYTKGRTIVQ